MIRARSMAKPTSTPAATTAGALKRSTSVNTVQPKKSPPFMEFPASPQLILGEEMVHFGHPQHLVAKINLPDRFTCSGCREDGAGKRYVCQQCNFQLHEFCALAPPVLKAHPFHSQHQLLFYAKPAKGGIVKSKCDVCGKAQKGYTFRCKACSFQMHPCCAMMSPTVSFPAHSHPLKLLPSSAAATASSGGEAARGFICGECKRGRRSGRVYRCTVCDYHLHAVCAKDMVNGLQAHGLKTQEKPQPVLATAARLASQVVVDFLGGLMEGLGEGVGEAFLDGVTRGNGGTRVIPHGRRG